MIWLLDQHSAAKLTRLSGLDLPPLTGLPELLHLSHGVWLDHQFRTNSREQPFEILFQKKGLQPIHITLQLAANHPVPLALARHLATKPVAAKCAPAPQN